MRLLCIAYILACLSILAGCGSQQIRANLGDTVADFEAKNKKYHLHTTTATGDVERRTYRDWEWSSPGAYVRRNRTYTITVVAGRVTSITEGD